MKDPLKLQRKLVDLLKEHPNLKLNDKLPWSEALFRENAWVVKDFVTNSGDVTNDDPLHSWLEEYHFFCQERSLSTKAKG